MLQKGNLQLMDTISEERATENLISVVKRRNEKKLEKFIMVFISRSQQPPVLQAMAKLLLLLCGDAPISAVVPIKYHQLILGTCDAVPDGGYMTKLQKMNKYGTEIAKLLQESIEHNFTKECIKFIKYLVNRAAQIHLKDRKLQEPVVINNSYNPEKGVAYYFTPHGNQIRKQPQYTMDPVNSNYDDLPSVDDVCEKKFPRVSYGGFGYMFLLFCPTHGHCYGFHLISGAKGRKDPFSSLFKYMPEAPSEIFYDFACQYSEYCLNREPQYFKLTRFWHDLFHGIQHKCGEIFKSTRVSGFKGVNSEICEQFNSYLQCIKYTGSHLSQPHFMFFVQFFVYLWNKDKTTKFQKLVEIAIAGSM